MQKVTAATIFIFFLLLTACFAEETYVVERVVNGDTLKLANGEKVRLIGIDAPQIHAAENIRKEVERSGRSIGAIAQLGVDARDFLRKFGIEGKEVTLEFDEKRVDSNGRWLAYVWISVRPQEFAEIENRTGLEFLDGISGFVEYQPPPQGSNEQEDWKVYSIHLNATILKQGHASPMIIAPNLKYAEEFGKLYQEAKDHKRGIWR